MNFCRMVRESVPTENASDLARNDLRHRELPSSGYKNAGHLRADFDIF